MRGFAFATQPTCGHLKRQLVDSVLCFHHVGPQDQTQAVRLGRNPPLSTEPSCQPLNVPFTMFLIETTSTSMSYGRKLRHRGTGTSTRDPKISQGVTKSGKGHRRSPLGLACRRTEGGRLGAQSSALKRGVVCVCVYTLGPGQDCPLPHLCAEVTLGDPVKQSLLNGEVQSSPDHQ